MSAKNQLILHRGAREATIDQVAAVPAPPPTDTWFPIPHIAMLEAVEETIAGTGFVVHGRALALSANANQFFGTLDLSAPVAGGVGLSVGIRNSIDKTLPLGFCAGNRVFVCDNLSFSAELLVNRKHIVHGGARFREAIAHAAGRLEAFRASESARVGLMQSLGLDDQGAESLILRAWEARIISHRQLPSVLREWREPSHDEFGPRNCWSLFNAFTEVLRPFSRTNPQAFAGRTFSLNRLLVPPDEGPADNAAALREIGPAADGHSAVSGDTEEREPDTERPAADDFWSSYQAGY
jgi:hypothetical protein